MAGGLRSRRPSVESVALDPDLVDLEDDEDLNRLDDQGTLCWRQEGFTRVPEHLIHSRPTCPQSFGSRRTGALWTHCNWQSRRISKT